MNKQDKETRKAAKEFIDAVKDDTIDFTAPFTRQQAKLLDGMANQLGIDPKYMPMLFVQMHINEGYQMLQKILTTRSATMN